MTTNKISLAIAFFCLTVATVTNAADTKSNNKQNGNGKTLTSNTVTKADNFPLSQSMTSVQKNLTRNPDSQGLINARDRLIANQNRMETRTDDVRYKSELDNMNKEIDKAQKREAKVNTKALEKNKYDRVKKQTNKTDRLQKAARAEKAERVVKMERNKK